MAPGKTAHSLVPGQASAPAYDPAEEQRMWAVWQDHARSAQEDGARDTRGVTRKPAASRVAHGATVKKPPPQKSASGPSFYEATLEQERLLEEKRAVQSSGKMASYVVSTVILTFIVIGIGALLLPTFPFLWRIPILGDLMMKFRNIILPTY